MILFLMAATSHDFWLRNLTPPVWKTLHMLEYVAYALLVAHVTLGLLQSETSLLLAVGTGFGLLTVITLHVAAARKEAIVDAKNLSPVADGFVNACAVSGIAEKCATVVSLNGERVAIFQVRRKNISDFECLPAPKRSTA
jgi:methionine sulfoxide reductase heme-binding subunit